MDKFSLKMDTLTNFAVFNKCKINKFVLSDDYIYIINPQKLEVILSLMELLCEFNNYYNVFAKGNITKWMNDKGINSTELLNEISAYKIKNNYDENISEIYHFIDYSKIDSLVSKNRLLQYLEYLMRENLKNIIIFDYLYNSKDTFNNYVEEVFNYYKSINMVPTKTFENFIYAILEIDKISLHKELSYIDNIKITANIENNMDTFCVRKLHNGNNEFFQECLNKNIGITFDINTSDNESFAKNLEKYIQIAEFITKKFLNDEFALLETLIPSKNTNTTIYSNKSIKYSLKNSNFYFINQNQILYFCLTDKNKKLLNEILPFEYSNYSFDKIHYFENDKINRIDFINYGRVKLL